MTFQVTCSATNGVEDGIGYDASTLASLNAFPFRSPRGHFQDILRRKLLRSPFVLYTYVYKQVCVKV